MDAYYFGFSKTGVLEIDQILSAVACAGKAYHHTEDWNDCPYDDNTSPVDWIQDAANDAAKKMRQKVTWVDNLDYCEDGKFYCFRDNEHRKSPVQFDLEEEELCFIGNNKCYSKEDLDIKYKDWRISLEPVPMPEVE